MKKIVLTLFFFATSAIAFAQVEKQDDRQETDLDKIQQETQQPAQIAQERAIRVDAQRLQKEKTAAKATKKKARKVAREKAKEPVVR